MEEKWNVAGKKMWTATMMLVLEQMHAFFGETLKILKIHNIEKQLNRQAQSKRN